MVGPVCRERAAEPLGASSSVLPHPAEEEEEEEALWGTPRVKEQVVLHGPAVSFCTQDG